MDVEKVTFFRQKLRRIEQEVIRQLKEETSCCGVSLAQCHALLELYKLGEATITNLADVLKLDKSTLSRTIDGLVKIGLVERTIDPNDRRFMQVCLSKQGIQFVNEIDETCNRFYGKMLQHIPQKKHKQLLDSLELLQQSFFLMRETQSSSQKEVQIERGVDG